MENEELKELAICAIKNNLDKFYKDGYKKYTYITNGLNISVSLWNSTKSREVKTCKTFLGFKILWNSETDFYKHSETEIFMVTKDWKDSITIDGSEIFDLVKNTVEKKTLKQQKEQLTKLCKNN